MKSSYKICLVIFISLINCFGFERLSYAQIPEEVLYKAPKEVDITHLATIKGFQKNSPILKLIKARIYITYIDGKATLNDSNDRDKNYLITSGFHKVKIISDAQKVFSYGMLTFEAKNQQVYQIKNNQAEKKKGDDLVFWIENINTGEIVTPKESFNTYTNQTQPIYTPVILNK
ncbi:hypothetical protein RFH39_14645 [Acinetobacter baumannii]|uniref:hypothetical protein n=1 Tax=Acinetobacter baumannii TaxID=470 RepID=UPI001D0E59F1|nr:hypothetical protein [Acinetobacter baumannii]MDC5576062.1 hypothetical protein [Acinetobacter baumannii]MDQ8919289.1 hypothetical protein [Acinetobacter baumannii]MDQ8950242.1 hypothetical protein [Acinetobacter baumannii]MDQ8964615.1 hypothetical protein [Acinetobacter baumannii]MDQ8968013.1 hypothetical protein [Acinetobacter baumannii]